jgi:hypothetical protein
MVMPLTLENIRAVEAAWLDGTLTKEDILPKFGYSDRCWPSDVKPVEPNGTPLLLSGLQPRKVSHFHTSMVVSARIPTNAVCALGKQSVTTPQGLATLLRSVDYESFLCLKLSNIVVDGQCQGCMSGLQQHLMQLLQRFFGYSFDPVDYAGARLWYSPSIGKMLQARQEELGHRFVILCREAFLQWLERPDNQTRLVFDHMECPVDPAVVPLDALNRSRWEASQLEYARVKEWFTAHPEALRRNQDHHVIDLYSLRSELGITYGETDD